MKNIEEDVRIQDLIIPDKSSHLLDENLTLKPDQSLRCQLAREDRFAKNLISSRHIKQFFGFPEILSHKKFLSNLIKLREDYLMPIY